MPASLKVFFLLFALIVVSFAHDEHQCRHDETDHDPEFLDIEEDMRLLGQSEDSGEQEDNERMLASASSFQIYPYFDYLRQTASSSYTSYVQHDLIPPIIAYFQSAVRVKYPVSGALKLGSSVGSICERNVPSVLRNGVNADFFIYYDAASTGGDTVATTKFCYLATGTKRPLIARTRINKNKLTIATRDVLTHEKNMITLMHEMMHALGFSANNYKYFIDGNGRTRTGHIKSVRINGVTRTFIDLPPLTSKLRNHFGCSSLQGAPLENSGGSGTSSSHFEKKAFLYEFMASGSMLGRRVSELGLAFLEGTGWYSVNYAYAEPYFYGKGQGCSFVTSTSCSFDEFCHTSNRGCSPTGRGGGSCNSDSLIGGGCKTFSPFEEYDCENENGEDYARLPDLQAYGRSAGSKCFTGTLNTRSSSSSTSFCFKYSCSGGSLTVQVGNHKVTCTREGPKTIDGYYGSVDCPNPTTFCNTVGKKFCPRNCMGRGTCSNGRCQCRSGFTGIDCGMRS